jgi:dipeptidyl aminopeptidase/acylaminoacyl peptidase
MRDIKNRLLFIIFFVFVSCSLVGQVTHKKKLSESDYSLWSTMEIKGSSDGGNWVSYNLAYESGNDTLVIRNKDATKVYSFAKGQDGIFGGKRWFACSLPGNKISIVDLEKESREEIENVQKFDISSDGKTIVVLRNNGLLTITYLEKIIAKIEHATDFVSNADKTGMVYSIAKEKTSLHYCPFDGNPEHFRMITSEAGINFEDITWQNNGNAFAFRKTYRTEFESKNKDNLYLYRLDIDKLYTFDFAALQELNNQKIITRTIKLSNDGMSVFFYAQVNNENHEKPIVQIWNGSDSWTYRQIEAGRKHMNSYCYVWWPNTGKIKKLTTDDKSYLVLSGDQKFAISFDPVGKQPEFSNGNKFTCTIQNTAVGHEYEQERKNVFATDEFTASYGGKYLLYRIDSEWFIYTLQSGNSRSMRSIFPIKIPDQANDRGGIKADFQIAGWTKGDKELLIYDEFDIWSINLENHKANRLTKGREANLIYRIVMPFGKTNKNTNFDGFTYPLLSPDKGLYLSTKGKLSKQSGYSWWNDKESKIALYDKTFDELCFKPGDKTIYFTKEDFDMPPELVAVAVDAGKEKTIFKSNPQHSNYSWGKSELIEYKDNIGNKLQGALFYPANYETGKKYPMVVYIYERLSDHVHTYVNPSVHNGGSVNISNLTSRGYFVLYPDIKYSMDKVGYTATNCVVNATKTVIERGLVNSDSIALVGHSFGGYEAAFIATQTDIFATVVVGAGVSNLLSSYLSIGWNNGRPEIWRYEHDQWRMSKSLFESMETYLQNSPIVHAKNVTTPILIWTGEQDRQVHYFQSIEFYNALRRLGKREIMLIYPNNRHRLTELASEADFNQRLEQWFDTFLKNLSPADWIKKEFD